MRKLAIALALAARCALSAESPRQAPSAPPRGEGERAMAVVRELSGPAYEGRQAGSRGGAAAAAYLGSLLEACGLETRALDFPERVPVYVREPRLALRLPGRPPKEYRFRSDYRDVANGAWVEPSAEGPLAYLEDPGAAFPRGAVVLVSGRDYDNARDASFLERGAAGLLVILDPASIERRSTCPGQAPGQLASPRGGLVKMAVSSAIAPELARAAASGARVSLGNPLGFEDRTCRDLLASWNGDGGGFEPRLLICAHYDHVGAGPGATAFPGALDNASGAALLVSLAGRFARDSRKADVAFLLTDAEEVNLSGAAAFARSPPFSLAGLRVLNLDMLGGAASLPIELFTNGDAAGGELAAEVARALRRAGFATRRKVAPNVDSGPLGLAGAAAVTLCELDESAYHTARDGPASVSAEELGRLSDALYAFASALAARGR